MAFLPFLANLIGLDGTPESGGLVNIYVKNTTTRQSVSTDEGGTIPATNPVVADSLGQVTFYFSDARSYTWRATTANGATTLWEAQVVGGVVAYSYLNDGLVVRFEQVATGDGSDTTFVVEDVILTSSHQVMVHIDGIYQGTSLYTVTNDGTDTTITFGTAPPNGSRIELRSNANMGLRGVPGVGLETLGTGVETALATNVGSAGAFVINGGALGTPSSGVVSATTVTATGGTQASTLAARFGEHLSLSTDFSAAVDNSTDDAAALTAAAAAAKVTNLKKGRLYADVGLTSLDQLKLEGEGSIRLQDGTTLPGFVRYRSTLSGGFDTNSNTVFDGDYSWNKVEWWRDDSERVQGLSTKYYSKPQQPHLEFYDAVTRGHSGIISFITANITAGVTTSVTLTSADGLTTGDTVSFMTNYVETSAADRRVITRSGNTISWTGPLANSYSTTDGTVTNSGRTAFVPRQMNMTMRQQGDGLILSLRGNIDVEEDTFYDGQTRSDNRATLGAISSDLNANCPGVNLTAYEQHLYANNNAVGMLLYTGGIQRDVSYGGYDEYVGYAYVQSGGAQAADFGLVIAGKWNNCFSSVVADVSGNSQAAYALAEGQRIYLDATAGSTLGSVSPGNTYIEQTVSDHAVRHVVQGIEGIVLGASGDVIRPSQAAVYAIKSSSTGTDVTGDGTNYTVVFDNEVLDQRGRYNNSTGVFTATAAGLYNFSGQIVVFNVGGGHTSGRIYLITSVGANVNFYSEPSDMVTGDGIAAMLFNATIYLADGETVEVQLSIAGSTKTVAVAGSASAETFLSITQVA